MSEVTLWVQSSGVSLRVINFSKWTRMSRKLYKKSEVLYKNYICSYLRPSFHIKLPHHTSLDLGFIGSVIDLRTGENLKVIVEISIE